MDEIQIVRSLLLRTTRGVPAGSPLAKEVLGWARANGAWLLGCTAAEAKKLNWSGLLRAIRSGPACAVPLPPLLELARELAALLGLEETDAAIVAVIVACNRLPGPSAIAEIASRHGQSLTALIGEAAGAEPQDAERRVRLSPLCRFGLVRLRQDWRGGTTLDIRWTLERLLDRAPSRADDIVALMVGPAQQARLPLTAFAHVADADFLIRLLRGARREGAAGINILIYGPPGTGKTELARTLAAEAELALHGVGEADDDGGEPDRWDRIGALQIGQRLLSHRRDCALLFDEMEDLIGDTQPSPGDWMREREGSKVFVNRMLETNPVPVIWTTNAIGNIDPAILRRMSFVLKLPLPSRETALRMLDHIAREEAAEPGDDLAQLIAVAPETASVLRTATRAARLAGEPEAGGRTAASLVRALRGAELPLDGPVGIDPELYVTDVPIEPLFARMCDSYAADVSLLLTGPPGTGKTALAHYLACKLDRPLIVKRASDLLSKWVGETERQIANAFAEARERGGVLLFDEADSLLFDRSNCHTSWEVGQVNELLTWLNRHPLPVVAATNHAARLDPATLRRFVFKLELRPFDPERAARAFSRFFAMDAPPALAAIRNLTAGDFALVARQLRHAPASCGEEIVERLRAEAAAKPGTMSRIGF